MRTLSSIYRRIAAPLAAVFIVSSIPSISFGQALTGSVGGTSIASSVQQNHENVTDIFIGKGTRGPYVLNWKQIDVESDVVVLNGSTLRRDQDYTIDPNGGVVAFTQSLTQGTIARVNYRITPGKAVQNNGGISVPLNLTLMQRTGRSLGLTGMLKQGSGTSANPGVTVVGMNMATDVGSVSKLTSQFMMSSLDDGGAGDKGSFWDRSAMNLGNDMKYGDVQVKTSLIRTGENFAGAKDYNLKQGQQFMDLAANYNPGSAVFASMSLKKTDDIGGQDKGATNTLLEQRVVFSFPKSPKMTLTHNLNEKETAVGDATERSDVSKVLVEHAFGKTVSASAFIEDAEVKKGSTEDSVRTTQMNLNATPNDKVNFASQLVMKDSEKQGESTAMSFSMNAKPSAKVSFASQLLLNDSEKQGESTGLNMSMNANPNKNVKVALGYSQLDVQNAGTTSNLNMVVDANAAQGVAVQTTYNVKDIDNQGTVTTAGVNVAAAVGQHVNVKTSVLNTDATNADGTQNKNVALVAKPTDKVNLSVGMGSKEVGEQKDDSRDVRVELKPNKNTSLNGGYKLSESGTVTTIVRDVSAAAKPLDFLEFSGFYKTRDVTGVDELDTLTVQWKLDPVKWFKLNGAYTENPEDKEKGAVQRYYARSLGVETNLGVLSLKGTFTSKDEYLAGKESAEKEVGMGLRMFGRGQLTTGYKIAELTQGIETATVTYSLGYAHNVGSDFNLSLTGRLTQYMKEQMLLEDQTDYRADLKVGMQF